MSPQRLSAPTTPPRPLEGLCDAGACSDRHSAGPSESECPAGSGDCGTETSTCVTSSPGAAGEACSEDDSATSTALQAQPVDGPELDEIVQHAAVVEAEPAEERRRLMAQRDKASQERLAALDREERTVARLQEELAATRRELELKSEEATRSEARFRDREAKSITQTIAMEKEIEQQQRALEALRLEKHCISVDVQHAETACQAAVARSSILEEELRLLKQTPVSAPKLNGPASGKYLSDTLITRYELACRRPVQPVDKDQQWSWFSCCSSLEMSRKASPSNSNGSTARAGAA